MKRFFLAKGRVQGVMFRQTFIRAAQKRNLRAGASNLSGGGEVSLTLEGEEGVVRELVEALQAVDPLNSWGACVEQLMEEREGSPVEAHQVHTENVDKFNWNPNIEMFL